MGKHPESIAHCIFAEARTTRPVPTRCCADSIRGRNADRFTQDRENRWKCQYSEAYRRSKRSIGCV